MQCQINMIFSTLLSYATNNEMEKCFALAHGDIMGIMGMCVSNSTFFSTIFGIMKFHNFPFKMLCLPSLLTEREGELPCFSH